MSKSSQLHILLPCYARAYDRNRGWVMTVITDMLSSMRTTIGRERILCFEDPATALQT